MASVGHTCCEGRQALTKALQKTVDDENPLGAVGTLV